MLCSEPSGVGVGVAAVQSTHSPSEGCFRLSDEAPGSKSEGWEVMRFVAVLFPSVILERL